MSVDAIESAILTRLADNWTTTPIAYANKPKPEKQDAFIVADVRFMGESQISIGTGASGRLYRNRGWIVLSIFVPKNEGSGVAARYADELAAIFRGQTFDKVVCLAPAADGGRPASEQGNHWLKTVTCEFYSDSLY